MWGREGEEEDFGMVQVSAEAALLFLSLLLLLSSYNGRQMVVIIGEREMK